jgi:hypothetical protein
LAGGAGFHAFVFGGGFLLVTPAGAGIRLFEIGKGACTFLFEKTPAEIKALSARQHFFDSLEFGVALRLLCRALCGCNRPEKQCQYLEANSANQQFP